MAVGLVRDQFRGEKGLTPAAEPDPGLGLFPAEERRFPRRERRPTAHPVPATGLAVPFTH